MDDNFDKKTAEELAEIAAHFITSGPIEAAGIRDIRLRRPSPEGRMYRFVHRNKEANQDTRYYLLYNWSIQPGKKDDPESMEWERDYVERELRESDHILPGKLCQPRPDEGSVSELGWDCYYLWDAGSHN